MGDREYWFIRTDNMQDMMFLVKKLLSEGWRMGTLIISTSNIKKREISYVQLMIRDIR